MRHRTQTLIKSTINLNLRYVFQLKKFFLQTYNDTKICIQALWITHFYLKKNYFIHLCIKNILSWKNPYFLFLSLTSTFFISRRRANISKSFSFLLCSQKLDMVDLVEKNSKGNAEFHILVSLYVSRKVEYMCFTKQDFNIVTNIFLVKQRGNLAILFLPFWQELTHK